METAACACETTECAKDKFCFVKSGTGYVFDAVKCKKSDASAKEDPACSCGYKAGAVAAVAKDEYCFVAADGTGTKVADPPCKKTDASAAEDPKCSCNGADSIVAVAKDKFCRVVAKKGYVVDSAKCAKADASAAEAAACTCGYKAGATVAIAVGERCMELADGTGKKFTAAPCAKTNGVDATKTTCMCGSGATAVDIASIPYVATGGTTCAAKAAACTNKDGTAANFPACTCGTDLTDVALGKFCREVNKKGYVTPKVKCSSVDASAKATGACSCGYKAGAIVDVAKDEYCFEAPDGTGTKVADPPCKKTDASAKEDPKCSCNGADSIVAVAKDKFCQVVAKKGYVTDSA